jgi:hypothetical protein
MFIAILCQKLSMHDQRIKLLYTLAGLVVAVVLFLLIAFVGKTFETGPDTGLMLAQSFSKSRLPADLFPDKPTEGAVVAGDRIVMPERHFSPKDMMPQNDVVSIEGGSAGLPEMSREKPGNWDGRAAWLTSRNSANGSGVSGSRGRVGGGGGSRGGGGGGGNPGAYINSEDLPPLFFFPGGDIPDVVDTSTSPGIGDDLFPPTDGDNNDFPNPPFVGDDQVNPLDFDGTGKNSFVGVPELPTVPNGVQEDPSTPGHDIVRVPDGTSALGAIAISMVILAGLRRRMG